MKPFVYAALLVVIVVSGLAFCNTLPFGKAQTRQTISGVITQDTTWTKINSPYILTGPVAVNAGVTLTIEPGVTVDLNTNYIQINGTLNARGTSSNLVNIKNGGITFAFSAASSSTIQEAAFCKASVTMATPITVTHNYNASFIVQDASPTISNNYGSFVEVWGGSAIISQNVNLSIAVQYGSPVIINNSIVGEAYLKGGNALVTNNVILYPAFFAIERGNPTIEGNLITTTVEVSAYAVPTIKNNTFTGTNQGISTGTGNVQLNLRYNNFQLTSGTRIYWGASSNLDASYNWWGTTDIQAINQSIYDFKNDFTLGSVSFLPILTRPNSQAPVILASNPLETGTPTPSTSPTPATPEFPSILIIITVVLVAALLVLANRCATPLKKKY